MRLRDKLLVALHCAVVIVVCRFVLSADCCDCPGESVPNDDEHTFSLGYCAQSGLNAIPLGASYLKAKFAGTDKKVDLQVGPQDQTIANVLNTGPGCRQYWYDNCLRRDSGEPLCESQLFAVSRFVNEQGIPIDTLLGVCWGDGMTPGAFSAFVCVDVANSMFWRVSVDDRKRAVMKATIHELGHLLANRKDCRDSPAEHSGRQCVMTDTGVAEIGGVWMLFNVCGGDVLGFSDEFCSWCLDEIKSLKLAPSP